MYRFRVRNVRSDPADVKDKDSNAMSTIALDYTEHDKEKEMILKTLKLSSL